MDHSCKGQLAGNAGFLFPRPFPIISGSSSPGRATASQAVGSGFESRLPLQSQFTCHPVIYSFVLINFVVLKECNGNRCIEQKT